MKILLALPLLVHLGCALAEVQSTSTSSSCVNGNCINCLNGVCSESRVKREDTYYNSSTLHEACRYNEYLHQYQCTGFDCTDGSCIHHNDKRRAPEPCHPGCSDCFNGECYIGGYMVNCLEYPDAPQCQRRGYDAYPPNCVRVPHDPRCRKTGVPLNLPNCYDYPDHPLCKNLGNHQLGMPDVPNCYEYPSDPRCNRHSGNLGMPNCLEYPNNPLCQRHDGNHQLGMINCRAYPDDPRCQGLPIGKYSPNSEYCKRTNDARCRGIYPGAYENGHYGGKRETPNPLPSGDGVFSQTCVNGYCNVCKNGICQKVKVNGRKREAQNQSSSLDCYNGTCTKCVNGNCSTYQE